MRRNALFSLLLGGVFVLLAGCASGLLGAGNSQPLGTLAPVLTEHPLLKNSNPELGFSPLPQGSRALLARYYWLDEHSHNGQKHLEANFWGVTYKPRQSNFQGFEGWDVLEMPPGWWKPEEAKGDWLRLHLNRPARVTVVWERKELWLTGWREGSLTISGKAYRTYTRDYPAGEVALGSPGKKGDQGDNYFVLLAEAGGQKSAAPPLPTGIAESQRPLPNQTCPSWLEGLWTVKNLYGATATQRFDGRDYKTWHPQVDPIYWCYYAHDHGSDPAWVRYVPAYEYVAEKFNGQAELHVGFKGFAIRDEGANQGWYVNIHSETGVESRACARFHTVVLAITDLRTGEIKAELAYKGDFGASRSNQGDNPLVQRTCLNPRTGQQETQAQIAAQTEASKRIRVFNGSQDVGGYEQWDGGLNKNLGMSFWGDDGSGTGMGIDIQNPHSGCASIQCENILSTNDRGLRRTIHFGNLRVRYTSQIQTADQADGKRDGYFWTDLYGDPLPAGKTGGEAGTIRQYVQPNFDSANGTDRGLQGGFATEDAWRQVYMRDVGATHVELEDGIGDQN